MAFSWGPQSFVNLENSAPLQLAFCGSRRDVMLRCDLKIYTYVIAAQPAVINTSIDFYSGPTAHLQLGVSNLFKLFTLVSKTKGSEGYYRNCPTQIGRRSRVSVQYH